MNVVVYEDSLLLIPVDKGDFEVLRNLNGRSLKWGAVPTESGVGTGGIVGGSRGMAVGPVPPVQEAAGPA